MLLVTVLKFLQRKILSGGTRLEFKRRKYYARQLFGRKHYDETRVRRRDSLLRRCLLEPLESDEPRSLVAEFFGETRGRPVKLQLSRDARRRGRQQPDV